LIALKSTRIKALFILAILFVSTGVVGAYATLQLETVPLEIKEPLEVLAYSSSLSLYPGETVPISVTIEDHASVGYNVSLIFSLNDTAYQKKFVNFSNNFYAIEPGKNNLDASLFVSETAPAAKLELAISITRDLASSPSPTPTTTNLSTYNLTSSATLLGAGAKWAAQNGTSVLYIDWLDNYNAHHFTDGVNWGPYWGNEYLSAIKNATIQALSQQGFNVTSVGDVPNDLSSYSLVVFEAWFAIEPKDNQLVRDYLTNGGNVVIIGGAPCFFSTYCKDMWPHQTGGENLSSLQDWFGSAQFVNSGGSANLSVDNPFGTSLVSKNQLYYIDAYGCYALTSMSNDSTVIARWSSGLVFAFTHEYGNGRVYYQATISW
jgi:hypothetical protein